MTAMSFRKILAVVAALTGTGFAYGANHCETLTCSDVTVWKSDIPGSPVGTNEGTRAFTICPADGNYYDWNNQKAETLVTTTDKVFFLTKRADANGRYEAWIDRIESVYSKVETIGDTSANSSGKCARTTLRPFPKRAG
jgi:hypothetical protein